MQMFVVQNSCPLHAVMGPKHGGIRKSWVLSLDLSFIRASGNSQNPLKLRFHTYNRVRKKYHHQCEIYSNYAHKTYLVWLQKKSLISLSAVYSCHNKIIPSYTDWNLWWQRIAFLYFHLWKLGQIFKICVLFWTCTLHRGSVFPTARQKSSW